MSKCKRMRITNQIIKKKKPSLIKSVKKDLSQSSLKIKV